MYPEASSFLKKRCGWIEVISGSMFSGKTEELIRRLRRAEIAKQKVEIFKPAIDKRYHEQNVVSHDSNSIRSTPVENSQRILLLSSGVDVVGIDEAQFFDLELINVCNTMANQGIRIIVAGLDMDFRGNPFGPIPGLMAVAEFVTKVHAICLECGSLANHSRRIDRSNESIVMIGETESYRPLCRECFAKSHAESIEKLNE